MILQSFKEKWFNRTINNDNEPNKIRSRRPLNTSFRQQRLKAWHLILSPQSVLPLLILISCMFAPIGIGLLVSSTSVQAISIDYTECDSLIVDSNYVEIPESYISYNFKKAMITKPQWRLISEANSEDLVCQLQFEIPNTIKESTYIYYKLTNFYQNHREYVDSVDLDQLKGKALSPSSLRDKCDPLRKLDGKAVYPCGLIANSIFNDTYSHQLTGFNGTENFLLTNNHTAWSTDKHRYKKTSYNASQIVPPPNWYKKFPNGYTDDNIPDLQNWEEFKIWMRPAGLPTFHKLILKNDTAVIPQGQYVANIGLNYPVKSFGGTKSFVLTTNSIVGAKNNSLGILYLVVAGISVVFALIFLVKVIAQPTKVENISYLDYHKAKISHPEEEEPPIDRNFREIL
ncbi:hypothetical protein Kpol_1028p14 [Vanderwaltozyma polyspora DSM 70294]|uniref:Cell division control protein 50 n=1 Tax=Vanderwaltozyma polyspora (strain ATCC 22028 / DSM 70294 / BCRC 21397 / CBS 2163 / NBRC 10782 / NRRL Y-8283 / UCD 57-17) TaxID=436907 RepID=A7TFY4_VANPO|nr:uncharacterized protein Kpol_1028p14 [Vanderwaltozyma polyspora DSM 70294]EDO18741.1 hypothetical protein Kpol_1028p14 [Vanderwaltozyma polyspora DSM 70294]